MKTEQEVRKKIEELEEASSTMLPTKIDDRAKAWLEYRAFIRGLKWVLGE
jgi:hypothetical protein